MSTRLDYPDPMLSDGVVTLRPWAYRDVECIRAAATDPRIPTGTTVPAVYSLAEGRAFIERQWSRRDTGQGLSFAMADPSDAAVGLIMIMFRADGHTVGLGYWVIPAERRRGYASRSVSLLAPWALSQPIVSAVEAIAEPDNVPSIRTLLSAGFEKVAVLPGYLDGRDAIRFLNRGGSA